MKIGDIVKHKLTNEKVLILSAWTEFSLAKSTYVRTGWECRTTKYDTRVFRDIELEELSGRPTRAKGGV